MATQDSGDSNLQKEPGNEVCDIINCVAIKGSSGNAFLRKDKFRAQVFVVDFLDLLNPFIVIHMYSRCVSGESGLNWRDFHALCVML